MADDRASGAAIERLEHMLDAADAVAGYVARVPDRAAHHYYKLDRDVVWDTAQAAVPAAGAAVRAALRELGHPAA